MISHLVTLAATNTCPLSPAESGGGFFGPIAKPLAAVLAAFYHVVPSYGVAILGLSVAWMIIISPLTLKSTRSMLAMQKIQPEIKRLQEKHKNDRQAFAQAQMDLFKERGVSPFGSCLPTLLPLPVFFALFRLIDGLSHKTKGCPTPQFLSPHTRMYHDIVAGGGALHSFGLNLAQNALSHHSSFLAAVPFFVLLLIMGGTQYLQTQQMMSRNPAASDNPQMRMMKYLPLVFMVFCVRFPAGVVLYYSMSNLCRIAQQSLMYRFDPKVRTLAARDVIDVESYTEEHEEEHRQERQSGKGGGAGKALPPAGRAGKAEASDEGKPARSRFSALLDAAREQKARDMEQRAQAKEAGGKATAGGRSGGGGKASPGGKTAGAGKSAGGGKAAGGGKTAGAGKSAGAGKAAGSGKAAGGGKAPAQPKGTASGGGGGTRRGGKNRPPGGGNRTNAERSSNTGGNGDRAAKANGATAKGASPRSGGQRTGAGNRTGARSGGNKKRRGR